jgi:putative tryptophan/tyrosine transport system substrate-binding protein
MTQGGHSSELIIAPSSDQVEPVRYRVLASGEAMRRREFIKVVATSAAAWPLAVAYAQKQFTIGYLGNASIEDAPDWFAGFRKGLKETGFTVGENLTIEYRPTKDQFNRFAEYANDLVRSGVDVIFAVDNAGALAAKAAAATIPIVFAIGGDPVALGLVASINRPGANVTGVSFLSTTIMAKRLELLHEAVPSASTVAALINPTNPNAQVDLTQLENAARDLGLQLQILNASKGTEIDQAFSKLTQISAKALVVEGDALFAGRHSRLIELAARDGVPMMLPVPAMAGDGGLMAYGASLPDAFHIAGVYAGRILKGEKPAELPVQQSTKVQFNVNLKTAKALNLTIPFSLLGRADEVIE